MDTMNTMNVMKAVGIITLIIILGMGTCSFGDDYSGELYNRANEHYTLKEYHEALDLYMELIERGIQNPLLYYNLANTYYRIGKKGYAVLYYEKALRLKPFDKEIRSNLKFVRRSLEDKISPLYNEGIFKFLQVIFSFLKLKIIVYGELFFFSASIALFIVFILFAAARNKIKKPLIVCTVLFAAMLIGSLSIRYNELHHPKGVILEKALEVKSSPIEESDFLFTLHEGTEVKFIEKRGEWIRFRIADGREGWILLNSIELVEPGILL